MLGILKDRGHVESMSCSLGLQDRSATAHHRLGAGGEGGEETLDRGPDRRPGAKVGVGGGFLTDPAPEGFIASNLMHGRSVTRRKGNC